MVGVVQLVERQVVILNVAGSSPVTHPTAQRRYLAPLSFSFSGARAISVLQALGDRQLDIHNYEFVAEMFYNACYLHRR